MRVELHVRSTLQEAARKPACQKHRAACQPLANEIMMPIGGKQPDCGLGPQVHNQILAPLFARRTICNIQTPKKNKPNNQNLTPRITGNVNLRSVAKSVLNYLNAAQPANPRAGIETRVIFQPDFMKSLRTIVKRSCSRFTRRVHFPQCLYTDLCGLPATCAQIAENHLNCGCPARFARPAQLLRIHPT